VLRDFAETRDLFIVEEIEESKSAKAPGNRPGFERMLKLIEQGKADAILCWSVNRLTRNPIDSGKLSWMLQNNTLLAIQTPEKQYLPTDNVLIFSVETGTANQYILDLKKSVARGTETKLAKGWSPHRAPEGYFNNLYNHTIEADGERFELIQRAWRLLVAGTHTPAQVIDLLNNDWGYRTRERYHAKDGTTGGGTKLSRSAGFRLFTNLFYTGYFKHGDQVYRGNHPAMLTLSEFEEVQQRLRGQVAKPHRHKHSFAYAGLLRCARCGRAVTAEKQPGRHKRGSYVYYHCVNASGTCDKRGLREEVLEAKIDACLSRITITDEFRQIVTEALEKWIGGEFGGLEGVYEQQNRTLIESEKMLSELVEMRLRGHIEDTLFLAKQRELTGKVSTLRLAIGKTQERLDRTRATIHRALDFRQTARAQFLTGDTAKRREIARALGVRYVFDGADVFIEMNPLLAYMQPDITAKTSAIEPREMGSESTKKTLSNERVSHGWPGGTDSETWIELFRRVWAGDVAFSFGSIHTN
jgi:DNA invertase Pin-like site-specific DNA recombinase